MSYQKYPIGFKFTDFEGQTNEVVSYLPYCNLYKVEDGHGGYWHDEQCDIDDCVGSVPKQKYPIGFKFNSMHGTLEVMGYNQDTYSVTNGFVEGALSTEEIDNLLQVQFPRPPQQISYPDLQDYLKNRQQRMETYEEYQLRKQLTNVA